MTLRAGSTVMLLLFLVAARPVYAAGDLDFDLGLAQAPVATKTQAEQEKIDRQVKQRRTLLKAHQIGGFTTLALLAATLVVGQLNWYHQFGGGDFTEKFNTPHLGLAVTTTAAFATTGILALAAPNPYPKPLKRDRALLHKISMILATAGMVTQIILGPISASMPGTVMQRRLAIGHLGTGYLTFAAMAVGTFAFVF